MTIMAVTGVGSAAMLTLLLLCILRRRPKEAKFSRVDVSDLDGTFTVEDEGEEEAELEEEELPAEQMKYDVDEWDDDMKPSRSAPAAREGVDWD